MADEERKNIEHEYNNATFGMNMDNTPIQIDKGRLTYALNAAVESFSDRGVSYQNELGNELCITFPESFVLIGHHYIIEQNKHIFFITNPLTGDSQIGYMENNDCEYRILVDAPCLNFSIYHPIHKVVHRITNFSTEIYWTDKYNPRRYLDVNNIPKIIRTGTPLCDPIYTSDIDCNQLKIQPNFDIPIISVKDISSTGNLIAGVYQFAVQYADAMGNPFTSYYSVTNPVPIADTTISTPDFSYPVGKSIIIDIDNLDTTGQFRYFNIAVIRTVNNIASVELLGTYSIETGYKQITYTGQGVTNIRLSIDDIFEKYPYYDIAGDLTTAQDILIWSDLTSVDRINYQHIANQIHLQWESYRIPATESYADEINSANFRSYLRDEVYTFEIQFLLSNGKETDSFHIPGREIGYNETINHDIAETDNDFIGTPSYYQGGVGYSPYWKIYNTASVTGFSPGYTSDPSYKGPYQYGEFAYWESTEEYPCNKDMWGELAGKKIRHHKFPDVLVSPIFESKVYVDKNSMVMGNDAIFPIGVKVDVDYIQSLIYTSSLRPDQKSEIVGFKILRGDRSTNKSIIAKGILRNVNTYKRDEIDYYYPNYPYNDLREDPFINSINNAYEGECESFIVEITKLVYDKNRGYDCAVVEYISCDNNKAATEIYTELTADDTICSINKPIILQGEGSVSYINYDVWNITWFPDNGNTGLCLPLGGYRVQYDDISKGLTSRWVSAIPVDNFDVKVVPGTTPVCTEGCTKGFPCKFIFATDDVNVALISFKESVRVNNRCTKSESLPAFTDKYRQIFNSPETSFGKPFLGDILKLESVIFGKGQAHFVNVKDSPKYRLISKEAQKEALDSAAALGGITTDFDVSAMFAAYQAYLEIYLKQITKRNYAYSFNSIASYDYFKNVPNDLGIKQRNIDIARYLIPSVVSVNDDKDINNWYRESSVYIKTSIDTPFPHESEEVLLYMPDYREDSRFTISEKGNCDTPEKKEDIHVMSYYASLKKEFINQWGQIYSYETIDTGLQCIFDRNLSTATAFGGDTFICRFAFKTKLPFFIDNRVGAPDDSDIFYDEIGNVGYPKYWHSARSVLDNYSIPPGDSNNSPGTLVNFISYKAHNFDCPSNTSPIPEIISSTTTTTTKQLNGILTDGNAARTFYDGYYYLFAYGIPNFYCESSYNVDLRQAINNREGDFWPHVTNSIPDNWLQESFVSVANDNTYNYNITYSKQNKENFFSHLPVDWDEDKCYMRYPFRAIYSDKQSENADNRVNTWRIYRAVSYFDFPQNFGKLISLDGIQNRAILARFENRTLLYDNLLTIDTSSIKAAYFGNDKLFKGGPPIDFADTDLGYVGSQHKMMLKIPQGQITVDAKRGHVFLVQGTNAVDISGFGSGMNRFFTEHLPFQILKDFPDIDIDNHFNGLGLHAVYDTKYERVIITKLDYKPTSDSVKYDELTKTFYIEADVEENSIPEYNLYIPIEGGDKWLVYPDAPQGIVCCNPVINTGERITGVHSGYMGERSLDDDFEYICVQGGPVGVARWKRTVLYKT